MSLFPVNTSNCITNPVTGTINVNSNALINVSTINGYQYNPSMTLSTFVTNPMFTNLDGANYSMSNINDITADTLLANGLTAGGISYLYDANISSIKELKLISTTTQFNLNSGGNMAIRTNNTFSVLAQDTTLQAVTAASLTAPTARIGNILNLNGQYTSQIYLNGDTIFPTSTLYGISSINGESYPPPRTEVSQWATLPAIAPIMPLAGTDLLLSNASATDIRIIASGTGGINLATIGGGPLFLGSFLTPTMGIFAGAINMAYGTCSMGILTGTTDILGTLNTSNITGVANINGVAYPPPSADVGTWWSYPAQGSINANNNLLVNVPEIKGIGPLDTMYIGANAQGVTVQTELINLVGTTNTIQATNKTSVYGYLDVLDTASVPALVNVSSINGASFPSLPIQRYAAFNTSQQLYPGTNQSFITWGSAITPPVELFANSDALMFWVAGVTDPSNYQYFMPKASGVYTITVDVGDAFATTDDIIQSDKLYAITFSLMEGLISPLPPINLGKLISCSRYEVGASFTNKAIVYPTVGTTTVYLEYLKYYCINTEFPPNSADTGYASSVNAKISFTRLF